MTDLQSTSSQPTAVRGEPGAQDPTFEEYAASSWTWLYRSSYRLAGSRAEAEDLMQQTLMRAYVSWGKVSSADQPAAYLRQMLGNVHVSQRRGKARSLEVLTATPPEGRPERATGLEDRLALWPQVASLPPRQRAVIVLRYYEQLSERETAETLGCSTGTVKSTTHRALKALRAALGTSTIEAEGTGAGAGARAVS